MIKESLPFGCLLALFLAMPRSAAADPVKDKAELKANAASEQTADKSERAANKAASDKAGNDMVANGDSLTATTQRGGPAERFARKGQLAMSSDAALTISSNSISGQDGSTTNIQLEPAADYFIIDNVSVGGFLEFKYTSASSSHSSKFGIGPRVGYNFTLSDLISLWPKAGLSIDSNSATNDVGAVGANMAGVKTSTTISSTSVALNLFVPLMFHPAPHFFAGFGPFLDTDLSGDQRATAWGGKLTIGGWITL